MDPDKIAKLYNIDELSTMEIGEKLGVSQWKVISLMRKYKIQRRTTAQATVLKFNKSSLSYSTKQNLSSDEQYLKSIGLALYWAEGAKANYGIVDFANSDCSMVKIFLKMLRNVYQVNEARIRVYLYLHAGQDINTLMHFWSESLDIPITSFTKPYIKDNTSIVSKENKMKHGLVHIRYNDKRLLAQILKDIGIITSNFEKPR